ncbi:MAG: hypothetical protein ACFB10_22195 [Salibacteraceae bacterium]
MTHFKIGLAALLVFATTACSYQYHSNNQALTYLPAGSPTSIVEVFYEGDVITRDYVEYFDLKVVKRGIFSEQDMIYYLEEDARNKGLDAILYPKMWNESYETMTVLDLAATIADDEDYTYTTQINLSIITGVGVKYVENIQLENSLKSGKIYQDSTVIGEVTFFPDGTVQRIQASSSKIRAVLKDFVTYRGPRLEEGEGMDGRCKVMMDKHGRISTRYYIGTKNREANKVKIYYKGKTDQVHSIRLVEEPVNYYRVSYVKYIYDQSGRVIERQVTGSKEIRQRMVYADKRLSAVKLVYPKDFYRIELAYFQQEDLAEMIQKVED